MVYKALVLGKRNLWAVTFTEWSPQGSHHTKQDLFKQYVCVCVVWGVVRGV